jgi:hypothetical protein
MIVPSLHTNRMLKIAIKGHCEEEEEEEEEEEKGKTARIVSLFSSKN